MKAEIRVLVLIIVFSLLMIIAVSSYFIFYWDSSTKDIIGGERDEHNCLSSAGYTFNQDIGACIRTWEINEESDIKAAKTAVEYVDETDWTIINIEEIDCTGCFNVNLDKNTERINLRLENWEIIEEDLLTVAECVAKDGRVVNSLDNGCNENEENIGCVDGCFVESICCVQTNTSAS